MNPIQLLLAIITLASLPAQAADKLDFVGDIGNGKMSNIRRPAARPAIVRKRFSTATSAELGRTVQFRDARLSVKLHVEGRRVATGTGVSSIAS